MLKGTRALAAIMAVAAVVAPVQGQFGGGSGGGGAGIPLSPSGGQSQSEGDKNDAKKSTTERPVRGVVTDADGKPVTGAVVQLKNTKTLQVSSVITHEKGDYSFSGLRKDVDYEVKAVMNDRSSAPHTLSTFDPRPQPVVNLRIK